MKKYNLTLSVLSYTHYKLFIVLAERKNTVSNNHTTHACWKWHIVGKVEALHSETICNYCC